MLDDSSMLTAMLRGAVAGGLNLEDILRAAAAAGLVPDAPPATSAFVDCDVDGDVNADVRPAAEPGQDEVGRVSASPSGTRPSALRVDPATSAVTVRQHLETVLQLATHADGQEERGGGLVRTYEPYWRLFVEGYPYQRKGTRTSSGARVGADAVPATERLFEGFGDRPLHSIRYSDIEAARKWVVRRAALDAHWKQVRRERAGRAGRVRNQKGADYNFVGAMRRFFDVAVNDDLIEEGQNPARRVRKPPKSEGTRRAFTEDELGQLWGEVVSGGDDPHLDSLLIETVLVTGARREGLINMSMRDLHRERATVMLHEKNGKTREQPATVDLVERLHEFASLRGSVRPHDPVFCFKDSTPERPHRLTSRRLDTLHRRLQTRLPWADRLGVTVHWFRHHAITQIERIAGKSVARLYAGHAVETVTDTYSKATHEEVCRAVSVMTGLPHPLADGRW